MFFFEKIYFKELQPCVLYLL